jgi:hypothetical protein
MITLTEPSPLRPFIQQLQTVLAETGEALLQGKWTGMGQFILDATKPSQGQPRTAEYVVEALVRNIPGFRDMDKVDGKGQCFALSTLSKLYTN